jgi:hypothetical protein
MDWAFRDNCREAALGYTAATRRLYESLRPTR